MTEQTIKQNAGIDRETYAGKAVTACQTKFRGILSDHSVTFALLDFVSLMLLNNKFASHGIFITDDNKEECYIKIIETGDDSLIEDLEKFINLKDEIKTLENKKQNYLTIINKLQRLSDFNDEAAVNEIIEAYLRR
jgi:hypothetical protein